MGVSDLENIKDIFPDGGTSDGVKIKVAGIVRDYAGDILLVVRQHKDGAVSIEPPGGALERGETLRKGLQRELGEELGYLHLTAIEERALVGVEDILYKDGNPKPRLTHYFKCSTLLGLPYNALPDEHKALIRVPYTPPADEAQLDSSYAALRDKAVELAQRVLDREKIVPNGEIQFRLPQQAYLHFHKSSVREPLI
ncbi:MAG: NUDIX hydrolase [Alphaproteobacteria bacterium]|nr:NUDIX hydrolase [Alphaproteobacteria bacterium]